MPAWYLLIKPCAICLGISGAKPHVHLNWVRVFLEARIESKQKAELDDACSELKAEMTAAPTQPLHDFSALRNRNRPALKRCLSGGITLLLLTSLQFK